MPFPECSSKPKLRLYSQKGNSMKHRVVPKLFFLGLISAAFCAAAQPSSSPVRLVVPLAAGGPSDQAARLIAHALSKSLGQDVIVDNKVGAAGAVGAQSVAASPADGHTLLFAPSGMTGLPVLMKNAPFASLTEFTPIGSVGGNQVCLFVHTGLAAKSAQEFVAYAKANPGKLSYGSSSAGEYLATAQLIQATGIQMERIPYKGSAQMMPDLLEGRIQVAFTPAAAGAPHVKTGRLKLLTCNVKERLPALPDTPTLQEAGVPDIGWHALHMVLAPAHLPKDISARLSTALRMAANDLGVRSEFEKLLIPVETLTPEQTTVAIRESERIWAKFVREAGIAPE
jgi:tripartite-type tricarboxylate transporter receptor subunit TctC